jgi:hypothetical protein
MEESVSYAYGEFSVSSFKQGDSLPILSRAVKVLKERDGMTLIPSMPGII